MAVINRKGQPLPDNHPLKGGLIIFGGLKPVAPPPIQKFDPPPLPEWEGPVEVVFSIEEETSDGDTSHCWVERRGDDFILFGNELGVMGKLCSSTVDALISSGAEFGTDYVTIESSLSKDDFEISIGNLLFENIVRLTVNGVDIDHPTAEKAVALYKRK